ncbi:MAG: hypothetical protein ABI983_04315 [Acidobacteriota bacterium]
MSLRAFGVLILALVAVWWPSRLSGLLDGAPLDHTADIVILGFALPLLLWLVPAALADRRARAIVFALLAWKAMSTSVLVQDGWCTRITPSRPYVRDGTGAPHNWDVRADWWSRDPQCSAITLQAYLDEMDFPVWFFNLPGADGNAPAAGDWPPDATTHLTTSGYFVAREAGTMRVATSATVQAEMRIDGQPVPLTGLNVAAGEHAVTIEATLTERGWMLAPLWNDADMWSAITATVAPMSTLDRLMRPWGEWITFALVIALLVIVLQHARDMFAARTVWLWLFVTGVAAAAAVTYVPMRRWQLVVVALLLACGLQWPERLKNIRGAALIIGVPWLVLVVVHAFYDSGVARMELLMPGNDWWQFQRFAYRIFMQGYWLEGGEKTFWFQPLYRWIAGALHMVFGHSQIGEHFWDGIGVLLMALFSFEVVRIVAGFRWGIAAVVLALSSFVAGPGWVFIGRGLGEISSAGFIYLAALCLIRGRGTSIPLLCAGGVLAVLGVWTRLNNLPMAMGLMVFAWQIDEPIKTLWRPREWLTRAWRPTLVIVPAGLAIGMALFALRTWHYTGTFSVFLGTQAGARAVWQEGMSFAQAAAAAFSSLMMVATTTDPPRYHNGSVPIMFGAAVSVAALSGAGWLGRLPFAPVLFTLAAFAGSLVARGSAYSGRFSVHVVGATIAVATCAFAIIAERTTRPPVTIRPHP